MLLNYCSIREIFNEFDKYVKSLFRGSSSWSATAVAVVLEEPQL